MVAYPQGACGAVERVMSQRCAHWAASYRRPRLPAIDVGNYGVGKAAGDELHYLTGLQPCTWSAVDAPRLKRSHPMRTIATYNATERQGGVMALWLMNVADAHP